MSEASSKRERAKTALNHIVVRAAFNGGADLAQSRAFVDLVIDAAKEELRSERRWEYLASLMENPLDGPMPAGASAEYERLKAEREADGHRESAASLGDEMVSGMAAFCDAVEANAVGGGPPMAPCHQCSTPCPCPGNWFTCPYCGLHQSKPEVRRKMVDEPEADSGLDPGRCPHCDAPFELVRPGKSQPTCDCWGRDV